VREVEQVARRQPVLFIGGAFVLGALVARVLKASPQGGADGGRTSRGGSTYAATAYGGAYPDASYQGSTYPETTPHGRA